MLQLFQAADELRLAGEFGAKEAVDHLNGGIVADHLAAKSKDLHIVMLDALVGAVGVVAARIPLILLQAITAPQPVLQNMMPRSAFPERIAPQICWAMSGKSTMSVE